MILCCGEALIDMLPRTTTEGAPAFTPAPGGAVFNTAIALGRLQVETGFWYGLSTDFFGRQLREHLAASGVDYHLAPHVDRPTTLAFVQLTEGQAEYAFFDENTAGRLVQSQDLPVPDASTQALFFGGISLVAEPVGSTLETLITDSARQHLIMLDPNIRPGFITDEEAYRKRLDRLVRHTDILKVSDQDLAWWLGDGAPETQARTLLAHGVSLVLVTLGGGGALALTARARVEVEAESVQVMDTVGAGDTFNAGVLEYLARHDYLDATALPDLSEQTLGALLQRAHQVAAVTVSRAGANPPWLDELKAS